MQVCADAAALAQFRPVYLQSTAMTALLSGATNALRTFLGDFRTATAVRVNDDRGASNQLANVL